MKAKQILTSPVTTAVLFVLAVALLLGTTIGGAQAAFSARTETSYNARLQTSQVGVALLENDITVEGDLALPGIPKNMVFGKTYDESLAVQNTGEIDAYVRVIIYKYWEKDKAKQYDLKPEYIKLNLLESGWFMDPSSTDERIVLYYTSPVAPGGTVEFADQLSISPVVEGLMQQDPKDKSITYAYDDAAFKIEVKADAVQTHNAESAIKSAWGVSKSAMHIN